MKYRGSSKEHDPPLVATIYIKTDVLNPPPGDGFPRWTPRCSGASVIEKGEGKTPRSRSVGFRGHGPA